MSYRSRKVQEETETLTISIDDFEALKIGDVIETDVTDLEVISIDTEFVVATDNDGNEYKIVVGDSNESDDTQEDDAVVLTLNVDDYNDLAVGDGIELDDDETIAVIELGENGAIAMGEDNTVYLIVPEGQEEEFVEAYMAEACKKTQESVTCPDCDSENCDKTETGYCCADCGTEFDSVDEHVLQVGDILPLEDGTDLTIVENEEGELVGQDAEGNLHELNEGILRRINYRLAANQHNASAHGYDRAARRRYYLASKLKGGNRFSRRIKTDLNRSGDLNKDLSTAFRKFTQISKQLGVDKSPSREHNQKAQGMYDGVRGDYYKARAARAQKKYEASGEKNENLDEANPWHGKDGKFPKGGKPTATVWSMYGKRRWIKKHPKTGKLYLKNVNANHKKWGNSNAASNRVAGRFASRRSSNQQVS